MIRPCDLGTFKQSDVGDKSGGWQNSGPGDMLKTSNLRQLIATPLNGSIGNNQLPDFFIFIKFSIFLSKNLRARRGLKSGWIITGRFEAIYFFFNRLLTRDVGPDATRPKP